MMLTEHSSNVALPLPISQAALDLAQRFSREASDQKKARKIQLNTISVWVMQSYLELMGLPTDLENSDSWNPLLRNLDDVADLRLPGLGQLECRPVESGEPCVTIPPEVWQERVGYSVVQIDELLQMAWVLGFVPAVNAEQLALDRLRSPEALLDHLEHLRATQRAPLSLSQWVQGVFTVGWEQLEGLFPVRSDLAFRGETQEVLTDSAQPDVLSRAKRIDLLPPDLDRPDQPLALILELQPTLSGAAICVKVCSMLEATLPPNLELSVLDSSDDLLISARSRRQDEGLQLQFEGEAGEEFMIVVALASASVTERFVI